MADKWIQDIFHKIEEEAEETQYKAWEESVVANSKKILNISAIIAGIDKMNRISGAILETGEQKAFASFIVALSVISFKNGWDKRGELMQ